MCEGIVYLIKGPERILLMEKVMFLTLKDGKLTLINEEGDERTLEGVRELSVDMVRHEVRVSVDSHSGRLTTIFSSDA